MSQKDQRILLNLKNSFVLRITPTYFKLSNFKRNYVYSLVIHFVTV